MPRFDNQCFVVTGGTRGIGLATARRIAGEGGRVLVTGLNHENLAAAAQIDGINVLRNEVSDPAAADVLAEEAHRLYGALDGVFLNAGIAIFARLGEITLEKFRKQFDVNVAGVLFGAQALAPLVRSDGTLLLMSSGAKTNGGPGAALYSGSKGAIRSITLALARELGHRGIRVNTISPGPIDTDFHKQISVPGISPSELEDIMKRMVPLGRLGLVEEAAAVATFLLSKESSFVTGADYPVDGGEAQL